MFCYSSDHLSRRSLLHSAAGTMFFAPLAGQLARAAERGGGKSQPKSVILLWMNGGPSQLETFDPHPGSPGGGEVAAIATRARGIRIADTLPRVAEQMDKIALIRSVTSKEGDHARAVYNLRTGWRPDPTVVHPSIGAVACHQLEGGAEIPRHISILPGAYGGRGGYLGARYDAFKVYDVAGPVPDVRRGVAEERFTRRVEDLMKVVEPSFGRGRLEQLDPQRTLHGVATRSALTMMTSAQLKAFEVTDEPQSERDAFGDTPFGRGCLAAARLIEVGVRCVEVSLDGWDSHVNNHVLQSSACETLDPAFAALLRRLEQRDLLGSTLVVWGGEFGRTPGINAAGGRDHWPHGFSMALAGCGIRGGAVHGATNPDPDLQREDPSADLPDPVSVADVQATILHTLGIEHERELDTPVGRPMRLSDGQPLRSVLV